MTTKVLHLAGPGRPDRRLWQTYIYWARSSFPEPVSPHLEMAQPLSCLSTRNQRSLQAILFATFALEYRLRNVYTLLGLGTRSGDGLWQLLSNVDKRATGATGFNNKRVKFPAEWKKVLPRIQKLLTLRNAIAHGNAQQVQLLLSAKKPSIRIQARRGYNSFIDAVRIMNVAIGYEDRRGAALRRYYAALKVRRG